MRTIKFRAKDFDGVWHYGSLVYTNILDAKIYSQTGKGSLKITDWLFVTPDTIGQFTGLKDENGKEIYEGDILRLGNSPSGVCEVKWNESIAAFCIRFYFEGEIGRRPLGKWVEIEKNIAIIGNIHDNPELLKGGEE